MSGHKLRIAFCLPKITGGADLLQQEQIAAGLQARGHTLTFVAPLNLTDVTCTNDLLTPTPARRTWSQHALFNVDHPGYAGICFPGNRHRLVYRLVLQ